MYWFENSLWSIWWSPGISEIVKAKRYSESTAQLGRDLSLLKTDLNISAILIWWHSDTDIFFNAMKWLTFSGIHPPNDKSTISAHLITIIHLISSLSCTVGVFQGIAVDAFVPTVTVISTSQDLRWMVQPTVITSVSPSSARQKTKSHDATQTAASHRAKPSNRKAHKEKVCWKTCKIMKSENISSRNAATIANRQSIFIWNDQTQYFSRLVFLNPCLTKWDKHSKHSRAAISNERTVVYEWNEEECAFTCLTRPCQWRSVLTPELKESPCRSDQPVLHPLKRRRGFKHASPRRIHTKWWWIFLAFQRGGGEEEGQEGEEQNCCGKVSQQTEGADRHSAGCK